MRVLELIDRLKEIHEAKGNIEILIEEVEIDWDCSYSYDLDEVIVNKFDIKEVNDDGMIIKSDGIVESKVERW